MHHSDSFSVDWWMKYGPGSLALTSKIYTFSKGFWFYPFYMGNRDKETSEFSGSKDMERNKNPNRVLERHKQPFNLQLQVDFLIPNWSRSKKLRRKTNVKIPVLFFLPCVTLWTFMTPGTIRHRWGCDLSVAEWTQSTNTFTETGFESMTGFSHFLAPELNHGS